MTIKIIQGDVRRILTTLPSDYFDCVVSSPPYYGLRSYISDNHPDKHLEIGLEPTLDAYLETMVAVCRELRRVLKPSGVCFINIGDSYNSSSQFNKSDKNVYHERTGETWPGHRKAILGIKHKDLCLVPERLGIALQRDGWWVRSHIIWAKPNPMPESVTDRPTSAHETIWMLTKNARYFWDAEAVAEVICTEPHAPGNKSHGRVNDGCTRNPDKIWGINGTRNLRNVWSVASHPFPGAHFATMPPEIVERCIKAGSSERGCCPACGAPWVRVVDKESYSARPNSGGIRGSQPNHHRGIGAPQRGNMYAETQTIGWQPSCKCNAVFPPDIAERCIKAGSSERGCCPACGAPWVRITSRESEQPYVEPSELDRFGTGDAGVHRKVGSVYQKWLDENPKKTIGWQPSCECRISGLIDCMPYTPIPSRILDPFAGAGTTGLVADRLGRDATLIDLNTSYIDMAVNRIRDDAPLFAEVAAE